MNNPDNLPVVGHMDNIKHNNNVSNLYWTKFPNTKAVDDGLMVNDIGISIVNQILLHVARTIITLVGVYGSISECRRCIEGSTKSSIAKVVDKTIKGTKGYYYKSISNEFYTNFSRFTKNMFRCWIYKEKEVIF